MEFNTKKGKRVEGLIINGKEIYYNLTMENVAAFEKLANEKENFGVNDMLTVFELLLLPESYDEVKTADISVAEDGTIMFEEISKIIIKAIEEEKKRSEALARERSPKFRAE